MKRHPLAGTAAQSAQSGRFQQLRRRKDRVAGRLITVGGVAVMGAMLLILVYLAGVVAPLFVGASTQTEGLGERPGWADSTRLLDLDERGDLGVRIDDRGTLTVFRVPGLDVLDQLDIGLDDNVSVSTVARDPSRPGLIAIGTEDGRVHLVAYDIERQPGAPGTPRPVSVTLDFPLDEVPRYFAPTAIDRLTLSDRDERLVVAAVAGRLLAVETGRRQVNFLTGDATFDMKLAQVELPFEPVGLVIDGNHRWVTVGDAAGRLHRFTLPGLAADQVLRVSEQPLTALAGLVGDVSLLAADASGVVTQAFPVRDDSGRQELRVIRRFESLGEPVSALLPERRRRGFVAVGEHGALGIYHSTAGQRVWQGRLPLDTSAALAFGPRAEQLLQLAEDGGVARLLIHNRHPEVTFATLWRKIWYENYPEPRHVWQSTAANVDFEPKFSLSPLVLGTLKATLYAMLFAVPVALLGATYTAVFMAPALRRKVKPAIELMAALPTVILGFLAGLWLAPFVERHLAGLLVMAALLPLGLLTFSYAWSQGPLRRGLKWTRGWEPVLLIPVIVSLMALALWLADPLQQWVVGGDLREWLSQEAGISYDQRNAIIVGIAMGISVIPIIYSIAEDALYAVPAHLSDGSLALGATRWQSLVRIVLPTASPGIFSGLMLGMGRAVGETMIVLMATGNTPIMDWNPLEGMRTLSANIAIEMPEASVASTHFRVLFLSALVLFVFTFVVNTAAELVRQRLRKRYASL